LDKIITISLMRRTVGVGVGLLLLSGCEAARNMGNDFARLTSSQPTSGQTKKPQPAPRPRAPASATLATSPASGEAAAASETPSRRPPPDGAAVTLSGKSEAELRDMLGTPTSEEERPPGKRWRYRDGQCTLDVQLYPDVQTKQFGTLAYEVKSDDNTDEGKRLCLAQIQSRVQARH
jgi:hypothetical protein